MRIHWTTGPYIMLALSLTWGCSARRIMVKSAGGLFDDVVLSLQAEEDAELAKYALASDIKLIDALRISQPKDRRLGKLAVLGRVSYAMAFVEGEEPARAARLYGRAAEDGFSLLGEVEGLREARDTRDEEGLSIALDRVKDRDFSILVWTVSAWAMWVNASRDDPGATSQVSLVERAIELILDRDEGFFHGLPHLMAGTFYASRAAMLGGDPERGRTHFERCTALGHGEFLMAPVLLAEYYAVQMQDKELFQSLLRDVISAPQNGPEELRLLNEVARVKAARLLSQTEDLFF